MLKHFILTDKRAFSLEFERCCKQYDSLEMATAWCGDPKHELPYSYLQKIKGTIKVTLGISFNQTHPQAITFFQKLKNADVRIYKNKDDFSNENELFHPKIYLFRNKNRKLALFVGSSNFTYSGFYNNIEANVLIEGIPNTQESKSIADIEAGLNLWSSKGLSFIPTTIWLKEYASLYVKSRRKERKNKVITQPLQEDKISLASWLKNADWDIYYKKVKNGLNNRRDQGSEYFSIIELAKKELCYPWDITYFDDLQKRKIMGGMNEYGALGNVAASGRLRHLLKAGTKKQKETIATVMNEICQMETPILWENLHAQLIRLKKLGFTMKVWGRFLSLMRPDLFCTVSSESVRSNLAETINMAQINFATPEGYIRLQKLLHSSPWFNSMPPKTMEENEVWKSRVAFMDAIFY